MTDKQAQHAKHLAYRNDRCSINDNAGVPYAPKKLNPAVIARFGIITDGARNDTSIASRTGEPTNQITG